MKRVIFGVVAASFIFVGSVLAQYWEEGSDDVCNQVYEECF